MDTDPILKIERPHSRLLVHYVITSCLIPPLAPILLPMLYFRYHSMRYRFDAEGVSMSWGILFRRQVNLTYARIQDIHLTSGLIQRWLGLADLHIQTASGSAGAEMKIEGMLNFEEVRDFLYTKMRGYRDRDRDRAAGGAYSVAAASASPVSAAAESELVAILLDLQSELRQVREALQSSSRGAAGDDAP